MFRSLFLMAAVVLFLLAALGAFGSITGLNYDGLLGIGLACATLGVLDFEDIVLFRRRR